MSQMIHDWPPAYTIKVHSKYKRLSLRISAGKGLELLVPQTTSQKKALAFLDSKYDWIQKYRHLLPTSTDLSMPDTLAFPPLNENWAIKYNQPLSRKLFSSDATQTLLLKEDKTPLCIPYLKKWLRGKANDYLTQLTQECSEKYGYAYRNVNVRFQNARWGSCSRNKDISLNGKLIFLPWEFAHYIVVHELVHTVHFNHSARFWAAVAKIIPEHATLRRELKTIEYSLPKWLY